MNQLHRVVVTFLLLISIPLSACVEIGGDEESPPDEDGSSVIGTTPDEGDGAPHPVAPTDTTTGEPALKYHPGHYIATNAFEWQRQEFMVQAATRPGVRGVVVRYLWKDLEPAFGVYDFSVIESDLTLMADHGAQLIARIEDKSFKPDVMPTPTYMWEHYTVPHSNHNGGYVARRWLPFVTDRMAALTQAMGARFDAHPNFEGVTFEESALGFSRAMQADYGYSPEAYRDETIRMLKNTRAHFPTSQVFWSMNFLPGRQSYLGDIAEAVVPWQIAMGGPDVLPDNDPLRNLAYPYYGQFRDRMVLFGSMQYSSYRHLHADKSYPTRYWTMDELFRFARDQLHVNYVFWTQQLASTPEDAYNWTHALPVIRDNPDFN